MTITESEKKIEKREFSSPIMKVIYTHKQERKYILDRNGFVWELKINRNRRNKIFPVSGLITEMSGNYCLKLMMSHDSQTIRIFNSDYPCFSCNIENKKVKLFDNSASFGIFLCEDNSIYSWGTKFGSVNTDCGYTCHPITSTICDKEIFISISCGAEHCLFLTRSKNVYGCGSNSHGQLGLKETVKYASNLTLIKDFNFISKVAGFRNNSFCIDFNGSLFALGISFGFQPKKLEFPPICYISTSNCLSTFLQDCNNNIWEISYLDKDELYKVNNLGKFDFQEELESNIFTEVDNYRKQYVSTVKSN